MKLLVISTKMKKNKEKRVKRLEEEIKKYEQNPDMQERLRGKIRSYSGQNKKKK
jgi:hypothetical protein